MDNLDRQIINHLQGGFPVVDRPFQVIADKLQTNESEIMTRITSMLDDGLLTRFGPLFNIDRMNGVYSLCAMKVPKNRFEKITNIVNRFPEVAHNYQRDHALNMWFVIAAESAQGLDKHILDISRETGLKVLSFPKQKEFYVNFRLDV